MRAVIKSECYLENSSMSYRHIMKLTYNPPLVAFFHNLCQKKEEEEQAAKELVSNYRQFRVAVLSWSSCYLLKRLQVR